MTLLSAQSEHGFITLDEGIAHGTYHTEKVIMQLRFRFYGRSKVKMCSSVTTLLPPTKVKSITYYHLTLLTETQRVTANFPAQPKRVRRKHQHQQQSPNRNAMIRPSLQHPLRWA